MFRNRRLDNGCVIMLICCGRIKNLNDASPPEIRKLVYYNFWNMELLDEMIDKLGNELLITIYGIKN